MPTLCTTWICSYLECWLRMLAISWFLDRIAECPLFCWFITDLFLDSTYYICLQRVPQKLSQIQNCYQNCDPIMWQYDHEGKIWYTYISTSLLVLLVTVKPAFGCTNSRLVVHLQQVDEKIKSSHRSCNKTASQPGLSVHQTHRLLLEQINYVW